MKIHRTTAIILKKIPYSERDLVVTLFTREGGRLNLFAPGAVGSKKRFGPTLDLFNCLEVHYGNGRSSSAGQMRQATLLEGMSGLRNDLTRFAVACYFSELLLEFLPERDAFPDLFQSFYSFLRLIGTHPLPLNHLIPTMEHEFLDHFGYRPTLDRCIDCRESIREGGGYFFSGIKGGVVCTGCSHGKSNGHGGQVGLNNYPLGYSAIQRLMMAREVDPKDWTKMGWKPHEISETRKALEYFIQYTAGKPIKSLNFLSKILS